MNLLDRHLFTSVLLTCAAAVGSFAFVVALPNVVRDILGPLLAGQFGFEKFVRLVALLVPFAITYALPMGILTGVLLTLGRLSADSEITAMRASGISVGRIARPVLVLGVVCTLAALYVNIVSSPWARKQFYRELADAVRADPLNVIQPKTFIRSFSGTVIYVGEKAGSVLRDIWIWELDDRSRVKRLIHAEACRLDFDEATNSLIPTFINAKTEERDPDNPEDFAKSPKVPSVDRSEGLRISLDNYFGKNLERMKDDWLSFDALQAKQAQLAAQEPAPGKAAQLARERMNLSVILNEKFTLSLAVFTFALIGVPLGIKVSRRETSANLGLALVLVLTFYLFTVMVKSLDRHPEYRPDLLLWLPNIVFLAYGIWQFLRIDRK